LVFIYVSDKLERGAPPPRGGVAKYKGFSKCPGMGMAVWHWKSNSRQSRTRAPLCWGAGSCGGKGTDLVEKKNIEKPVKRGETPQTKGGGGGGGGGGNSDEAHPRRLFRIEEIGEKAGQGRKKGGDTSGQCGTPLFPRLQEP